MKSSRKHAWIDEVGFLILYYVVSYIILCIIAYNEAKLSTFDGRSASVHITLYCGRWIADSDPPRTAGDSAFTVDVNSC